MAGYKGYSMSNNAVTAYEEGKKPFSKWTKTAILDELEKQVYHGEIPESLLHEAETLKASELKDFLKYSEWHHTSSHYKRTPFYTVNTYRLLSHFGYVLRIQINTPDGIKTGEWGGELKPDGFGYQSFIADDGTVYDCTAVSTGKIVYVKGAR